MNLTNQGILMANSYYLRILTTIIRNVPFVFRCYSWVGKQTREQRISIGRGCERMGTVVHEILHALGFFHEQSRLDRDDYVTINYQNIVPSRKLSS